LLSGPEVFVHQKSNYDQPRFHNGCSSSAPTTPDRPNKTPGILQIRQDKSWKIGSAGMHDAKEGPEPISAIQSLRLDLPPSCVEFCPVHPSYLLIGTYNLQKEEDTPAVDEGADDGLPAAGQVKAQNRNGSIVVFRMTDKAL